ncbi:MAG: right-handed parallel beta-helix repeat-containing protein [Candidatus Thorarchaeota archaeon]
MTRNNTISGKSDGIQFSYSLNATIVDNTITENSFNGVNLDHSMYSTVVNNTITESVESGVYIFSSSRNTIKDNTLSGNTDYGVSIHSSSSYNHVYLNVLSDNNWGNAYDGGTDNRWNTTGIGNYWSDHTGSGVYNIAGVAGAIDYHPFVYPPVATITSTTSTNGGPTQDSELPLTQILFVVGSLCILVIVIVSIVCVSKKRT